MGVPANVRTRWAALGAATAVSIGAGGVGLLHATEPDGAGAFVAITPCRLFDTRADSQVGPRGAPIGPDGTLDVAATGARGDCDLPTDATGVVLNVTAVGATQPTFLTIWPTGAERPLASSLNPFPGEPPTPNAVTTDLGGGSFSVFNYQGTVDVLADVVGYYTDHSHDDRYYTRAQVDALLDDVAPAPTPTPGLGDALGNYYVETNVGGAPTVLATFGPLTYRLVCTDNSGSTEYRIEITSSVGPWYTDSTEHPAGFVYAAAVGATNDGVPDYNYWAAPVFVPSAGIVVADEGYRNIVMTEYPGADCRAAGSIVPIDAG